MARDLLYPRVSGVSRTVGKAADEEAADETNPEALPGPRNQKERAP
jgi:hypothetical protein